MEVIPSHLSFSNFYDGNIFGNIRLRIGEVHEVVPPDDKRSISGKVLEYKVYAQHRENGTAVSKMYDHCVLMNTFGGVADRLVYTLRADPVAADENRAPGPGVGSKVLLLCINGESHNAVIIGGVRDAKDGKDDPIKGHHLQFTFNGVDVLIDKDGQLIVNVNGATDALGKPAKGAQTDKLPTTVKIEKDGKFTVQTKDGMNSIVVAQDGTVTVTAEKTATAQCGPNNLTIKNDGSISINAEKAVTITSKGPVTVKASAKCSVIAKQVELGSSGIAGLPPNGVVLGSWVEPLTGKPVWMLQGQSTKVFSAK